MESLNSQEISPNFFEELERETLTGIGEVYQWQGCWFHPEHLLGTIAANSNFVAADEDVILASPAKAGSTWLKAIIPCIVNHKDSYDYDPFMKYHPKSLMPHLEIEIYSRNPNADLSGMPSPRLFTTHIPYGLLPESVKQSACKIIYIARNPKDVFVSLWYFMNTRFDYPFNESFDKFCRGIHFFGPYHDHVLGYWKESQKRPEKILFLKYEEMKNDPMDQVQKLSNFLGKSLGEEEVNKILEKCSLERMKNLEINQNGKDPRTRFSNGSYFRKGTVGDWKNHLSPEMGQRLDNITKMKLDGSGLEL